MKDPHQVAVTSRSFSKNPVLREALTARYTQVKFNDEGIALKGQALIDFLCDAERVILGLESMTAEVFDQLPKLSVISRMGVGVDCLDLAAMVERNIRLSTTIGVNKRAVAELVISFSIILLRQLPQLNAQLKAATWCQLPGRQLSDCTVGIIGFGAIGQEVARLLLALGTRLLVHDIQTTSIEQADPNLEFVSLNTLLQEADLVTLHVPLTPQTKNLLNEERLALLKKTAIVINTARGGLVDEAALLRCLQAGRLAAAAFDVFETEPPGSHPLLEHPNFYATPHIGGSTQEAILAMGLAAIAGLDSATLPRHFIKELSDVSV